MIFSHFRSLSIRKGACENVFFGSVQKISRLDSQSRLQTFTLFTSRHIGGSRRSSNIAAPYCALRVRVRVRVIQRISQLWDNAHTLNFEKCLLYLSSVISQFLDFIYCMVFDFIFFCVAMHILYFRFQLPCYKRGPQA